MADEADQTLTRLGLEDPNGGQLMKTPVGGQVKKADPSSHQGRHAMTSTL
jgi:hypothetical protein